MLAFVALTATLNLCVGYALGVWIGEMPALPQLRRRQPVEPPEPSIDLTPTPVDPPSVTPAVREEPPKESTEAPLPTPSPSLAPAEKAKKSKVSTAEIQQGLAAFQAQLAQAGAEMNAAIDDDDAFGECANKLQQANHEYLEQAEDDIERLDDDSAGSRDAIAKGVKRVGEASGRIDSLLADGVPAREKRSELINETEAIERLVAEVEGSITDTPPAEEAPTAEEAEPAGADAAPVEEEIDTDDAPAINDTEMLGIAPLEEAERRIAEALQDNNSQMFVAGIDRDTVELPESADAATLEAALFQALVNLSLETVGESQLVTASGERLLLVLDGDDLDSASARVEQLRQQVEKATFVSGEEQVHATITCGLVEADPSATQEELMQRLEEALQEADQEGGNRTYHHDGHYPAPASADGVKASAQTVAI